MADIKINGATPSGFYYGGTPASAVYYGSTKLWEAAPPQTTVVIGGKTYPTVTLPDGREWLAANLDYTWTGLSVPTSGASASSGQQAMYYNYDESTYGWNGQKLGLLYNHAAVKNLELNIATWIPGWHVPTESDFEALITALGGTSYGSKLKSTTGWRDNGNGTDNYGFAGYPSGTFTGSWGSLDIQLRFWTTTVDSSVQKAKYYVLLYNNSNLGSNYAAYSQQYSVRLIKDY